MTGCHLHQNPVTFYFNLLVFSQGISDSKICNNLVLKLQCIEFCREIKEYHTILVSVAMNPQILLINDTLTF